MTKPAFKHLIIIASVVLVLDQITKQIALEYLTLGQSVPFLGNFFRWTLTYNPGGAFGMKLGSPFYYLITSSIIFALLIYYISRNLDKPSITIPLSLVTGGAAGNIIDRFRFGEVVDFIDVEFFDIHWGFYNMTRWPIFNIADIAVSCGIITTVLLMMLHPDKKKPADKESNTEESESKSENKPEVS